MNENEMFGLTLKMKCVNLFTTKGDQISCNFEIVTDVTDDEEDEVINVFDNETDQDENDARVSKYADIFTKNAD